MRREEQLAQEIEGANPQVHLYFDVGYHLADTFRKFVSDDKDSNNLLDSKEKWALIFVANILDPDTE